MATITAHQQTIRPTSSKVDYGAVARLALAAVLPLAAFSAVNAMAEAAGIEPRFFAPANLPGWAGAVLHLALLFSMGLAIGLAAGKSKTILAWGVALVAAVITFPFIAAPLDSLALALMMAAILLLTIATAIRVAALSRLGGWLMLPSLLWLGFGAALGLAMAAAWSPPFALITAQNPTPVAG